MKSYTLITGASSGIGKEFANFFAKEKKNLLLVARSEKKLLTLKQELEKENTIDVKTLIFDLTEPNIGTTIYNYVKSENIFVETLVNCAGYGLNGNVSDLDYKDQHNEIMLNIVSLFDMTKLFLDSMLKMNKGTIINVASTSAYHPIPTMAVYAASKAFVLSFTEALAIECTHSQVRVFAISPGATDTNFFSSGGGVSYGTLRTPQHVVKVTMNALNKKKISKIDGMNNYFTSTILPRILPRKRMAKMVYNIMQKQKQKE